MLVVTPLSCSLVGQEETVRILAGSRSASLYRATEATEGYWCNYGLSPTWEARLEERGLRVTARGSDGEVRIVELDEHPFFLATLFLPQLRSAPGAPHPLLRAFVDAAEPS
jgi:CTP synthase (UTP-ammonia lyase)